MKKRAMGLLCCAAALSLLLTGCTGQQTAGSAPEEVSVPSGGTTPGEDVSTPPTGNPSEPDPSAPEEPGDTSSVDAVPVIGVVIRRPEDLRMDYLRLSNMDMVTQELLDQSIKTATLKLTPTADPSLLGPGAAAGIRFHFTGNTTWEQVILAKKRAEPLSNGISEEVLIDPVEGSLNAYEGIRFYCSLERAEGRRTALTKLRFTMGAWSSGYRTMYEYTYIFPEGDYAGYIEIPFADMVNGYNQNPGCDKNTIDYFSFNVSTEGSLEDMQLCVSDFEAYRQIFW